MNRLILLSAAIFITLLSFAGCSQTAETPTSTTAPPTQIPTNTPISLTETPVPPTPTAEPTDTPIPPTETPILPTPTAEPTNTPIPPTATPIPPTPTSTPVPPTATPEPFITVTDLMGRIVEIPEIPSRIVSISPTATETLYTVGGIAIARDSSSTFPPEVENLPELGGAYSPNMEAIAAQNPDLIIIEALTQGHLIDALERFGAPVVAVRAASAEDVSQSIKLIGDITQNQVQAKQAIDDITSRISAATNDTANDKSVLILISDQNRLLYVARPDSYPGAVITSLNMTNLAEGVPQAGSLPGFTRVSAEQVIELDPEIIFAISPAPPPAPTLSSVFGIIPGFSGLTAYKEGRLYEIDPVLFLRAQGPRIANAVEHMAELVKGVE